MQHSWTETHSPDIMIAFVSTHNQNCWSHLVEVFSRLTDTVL
jgi:hypothetical protein